MELVAGAMGSLLPKLGELLKEEYGLQKGVKKKIESLSRELTVVHAVLRKIGDVPPDQLDELVRLWASEVREASYDMEDIVDTFLVRVEDPNEATEPHMLRRLRKKVGRLFKKSKARHKISSLIDDINEKLEEVATRRGRYTLDSIVASPVAANTIDPRILNLYKRATELVGIEGPRDELINMLSLEDGDVDLSSTTKMKILSIVGFGGLGKTTLAKAVYDHLKPRFECRAFVLVGQNPDIKKVFGDILIALDEQTYTRPKLMGLDENQLMGKLNEFVKEKRCLIVIDDIWDKKTWKLVRCALQESNCGSRLVITTRISEVAAYADEAYKIQPLSHDNSENLLYARIDDGEGKYFDSLSAETCERILKKCGGVPLAIITIASLLASKPREDWSEVYNSIGFGHKGNDDVDNTRRILSFSYYDLPSHLKACLLYLSIFPEDYMIDKNSLIWKWIAEGFISKEQAAAAGVGLFELGERYFNELINRNMIQAQETRYIGYVDACSVHDMVLDLIHQLSSEENFVTVLNGGERQKLQGSISRRLALQCVDDNNVGLLSNVDVEKVRSVFAGQYDFCALCPRVPFLRVVDCGRGVPRHLGSLLHLRYLRLHRITKLPSEVRYLRFLQTLDLGDTCIEELPEEVGLLTQLVCLRLHSDDWAIRVPAGLIGKLTSLQELRVSCGGEDAIIMQFVEELGLLKELRVFEVVFFVRISESIESALLESLGHLHNIQELQIVNYLSKYRVNEAGSLSYCRHLRFLCLICLVFSALPAWINSSLAPNLSYLDVQVVVVKDQDMETLAKLPELSRLVLRSGDTNKSVVSIKIRTDKGVVYFRRLRFLKILGPSIWFDLGGSECNSSRVPSNNTIMPSLESLKFVVHVRSLKDENLHLGFDKLIGFQNLGTSSLQIVKTKVYCGGASIWDVEEAEAALEHAAAVHPKHPTLLTNRVESEDMISRYREACMEMSKAPELVTKAWKFVDGIVGSGQIQILRMPDLTASSSKVMRLLYTDNGVALLALSSNAVHKLWKWEHRDKNPRGKSSKSVPPVLWQPENGIPMTNDTIDGNDPKEATACTALSTNDSYLISASGGKVSLFNMMTFKVLSTFMAPPPATTFLAVYPLNNDIIAIGREDSSIQIYDVFIDEVTTVLTGHHKKITGLAFSQSMEVLVSSGADAQLCVWSIGGWEKKKSRYIKHPSNGSGALVGDTMVQFHYDGMHLLVVHGSQLAIYDWQLECLCSWYPRDALPAPISSAVYSLGCLLVYAGFRDGAIGIFEAESLMLQCWIAPSAYVPSSISSGGETVYPTVVATHPCKPNQIAVGMSDGAVYVLEPLDTDDGQVGSDTSSEQRPPSNVSSTGGDSQPSV
ncbi:disease resistance protein Pik-2-like [Miscanthus floridulus]|uniref:disease resistance protein Pik-2-like n=1 Tax=Miscanthus floridulus TaxID=154761 RepID=UPI0034594AEE